MNISKAQIAALVLGYLKSEKLSSVVEEFTRCCGHFMENNANVKMGKYFVTRVAGLTLVDIIEQYSVIYAIVQSRLEETDYFELYSRTTLVEQLLYLVDKEANVTTSTPLDCSNSSEVDATPAHSLPGNSSSFQENENSLPKTPKKRNTRSKSKEKEEVIDMTEVLTQSLLENHELHEKIAETINIVRNTPDSAKPTIDERISAGASKEIDAVIKTVIQRTEEDPVYNKLIDEIIGTPFENPPTKKLQFSSTPSTNLDAQFHPRPDEAPPTELKTDLIEVHNNDAIRSIIEAAQNSDPPPLPPASPTNVDSAPATAPPPPPPPPPPPSTKPETGEVYVFDGTLDSYLKTSGATNPINQNLYINPGGLIVMPPPEPAKQFYIVNNTQPVLKMNMPTVLTENEFMSIPTIIVSDEPAEPKRSKAVKPIKPIKPKGSERVAKVPKIPKGKPTEPGVSDAPRIASHVRNLDFSTPIGKKKTSKEWDSDLRQLLTGCQDKSPSPKRKRVVTKKKKTKKDEEEKTAEEREKQGLLTPVKDVPKTPGGPLDAFHCTPFNDVIDEQLRGVDLSSIPTPSLPLTPGFALTPGDMVGTNHRSTDYSTSSSYYQPSEPEPPKSTEELMEELRELDNISPSPQKNVKILSNMVITPAREATVEKKSYNDYVNKFNKKVIGKKNLNLIKQLSTSSSSSGSDSDGAKDETVLCTNSTATIKDIICNVQVKKTLDEDKKSLLSNLEMVRKRTVDKLKNDGTRRKQPARNMKKPAPKGKKNAKKKEKSPENDALKLVEGLAQRGIHLIPNKTPQKPNEIHPGETMEEVIFDNKEFTYETVVHEDKTKRRNIKTYDFSLLNKPMSATVFDDDLNQEVTRIMKWTTCECIYDSRENKLINSVAGGGESPKTEAKGGRKRKSKLSEDEVKHKEKKSKTYVNYNKLLKNVDVEDFLDKLHGE